MSITTARQTREAKATAAHRADVEVLAYQLGKHGFTAVAGRDEQIWFEFHAEVEPGKRVLVVRVAVVDEGYFDVCAFERAGVLSWKASFANAPIYVVESTAINAAQV